jgi:hypothetical protein
MQGMPTGAAGRALVGKKSRNPLGLRGIHGKRRGQTGSGLSHKWDNFCPESGTAVPKVGLPAGESALEGLFQAIEEVILPIEGLLSPTEGLVSSIEGLLLAKRGLISSIEGLHLPNRGVISSIEGLHLPN